MTLGNCLRELADAADALEAAGFDVVDVDGDIAVGDAVTARLSIRVPVLDGVDIDDRIEIGLADADVEDDGTVAAIVSVTVPTEDAGDDTPAAEEGDDTPAAGDASGNTPAAEDAGDGTPAGEEDGIGSGDREPAAIPPYKDPGRLEEVYREHGSFAEMTEALGVDVSPQTVRRHMIKHGIHEPRRTGPARDDATRNDGAGGDGSPAADEGADGGGTVGGEDAGTTLADGIDLPADTDLDEVKRVVRTAHTLHEAGRELGIGRDRARRLLDELDLLDLVTGRLSTTDERRPSIEEMDERIRGASPEGAR